MRRIPAPLVAIALLGAPAPAAAWCRTTSVTQTDPTACVSAGVVLAWPVRCISLSLNESELPPGMTAPQVRGLLDDALGAWTAARCGGQRAAVDLSRGAATLARAGYAVTGPNANVVVFRSDWAAAGLPPSAIALTTVTFGATTGDVRDADVMVNLSVPLSASGAARTNDLPTALVHEVGHVLGIDHSNERTAVMWYGAGRGEQRRALQADDVAALCAIHPPTLQRPCAPPADDSGCGCRAAGTGRGGPLVGCALLAGITLRRRRLRARARRAVLGSPEPSCSAPR